MEGERPPCRQKICQVMPLSANMCLCVCSCTACMLDVTHLVFNECGQGEIVKQVSEESPYVGVSVFSKTFIVEAIHLSDLS